MICRSFLEIEVNKGGRRIWIKLYDLTHRTLL